MRSFPSTHAHTRSWGIEGLHHSRYRALDANWTTSRITIAAIREALHEARLDPAIRTVAVAGSLGRMEASRLSDADLIILLRDGIDPEAPEAQRAYRSVWHALTPLSIEEPRDTGVFSTPCTEEVLCGAGVGHAEEGLPVFGKRLLLLLESQPVWGDEAYTSLMDALVLRYARTSVALDPGREWEFLLNDLLRYFKVLCVSYQWDVENDAGKWPLRMIKLHHSRLIMYAGLLLLLGEASKEKDDKVSWLRARLCMTPLERMAWVYGVNGDNTFQRIATPYNVFVSRMNDGRVRGILQIRREKGPAQAADMDPSFRSSYGELRANGDALVSELLRFVLARRRDWSQRFFECFLF